MSNCTNHFADGSKIFPQRDCCAGELTEEQERLAESRGWHQESSGLWNCVSRRMHGREVEDVLEDLKSVTSVVTK